MQRPRSPRNNSTEHGWKGPESKGGFRDHPEPAETAAVEPWKVIAGDVLHHGTAPPLRLSPERHHPNLEKLPPQGPEGAVERPGRRGGHQASDRQRQGFALERDPLPLLSQLGQYLSDPPGGADGDREVIAPMIQLAVERGRRHDGRLFRDRRSLLAEPHGARRQHG